MNKKKLETAKQKNASNPALDLFSLTATKSKQEPIAKPGKVPEGYKMNPMYVEIKSKRVQLVFQPSIYKRAKAAADKAGLSLNEYLHRLIDENTERKK